MNAQREENRTRPGVAKNRTIVANAPSSAVKASNGRFLLVRSAKAPAGGASTSVAAIVAEIR